MPGIYTYEVDNDIFFNSIKNFLSNGKTKSEKRILELIQGGYCKIIPDYPNVPRDNRFLGMALHSNYPALLEEYKRFKENSIVLNATACFYVSDINFNCTPTMEKKLIKLCNDVIDPISGLKITGFEFKQLIDKYKPMDIEESIKNFSNNIIKEILPLEVQEKAIEMAKVYLYLFCIENSLRLFIEKIAKENYGDSYFESLKITTEINNNIKSRKNEELRKKWMGIRGDSDLFYLDFKDLGTIIQQNWPLFKNYFPNQPFILSKIDEMYDKRNIIAHNGYIPQEKRELFKVYYENILAQLDGNY